ncbi:MAG: hypothetical protein P8X83_03450 [Nitrosopumilaceae archaeon]
MEDNDVITWSKNYFLKWSDFTADPSHSAFEDSSSNIKYHHTWTVRSEMTDGKIFYVIDRINISTLFFRHLSWVRTQNSSDNQLNHEQGHFDLAESIKPKIIKNIENKFRDKTFPTRGQNEEQRKQFAREDSGIMISAELEKWHKILSEKRRQYDADTEYGQNLKKQTEYDEIFKKLRN